MNKEKFFRDIDKYEVAVLMCYKIMGYHITYKTIKQMTGFSLGLISKCVKNLSDNKYLGGINIEISDVKKN